LVKSQFFALNSFENDEWKEFQLSFNNISINKNDQMTYFTFVSYKNWHKWN